MMSLPSIQNIQDTYPYKLLIGFEVTDDYKCPFTLDVVDFAVNHQKYIVKGKLPDAVIQQWISIWNDKDKKRAFNADFDRYKEDGSVEVNVEYLSG